MKKILGFLLFFVLTAPAISPAAVNMTSYFPLNPGNSWTYRVQDASMTITETILAGTVNINGADTKIYESSQGLREYFTNDASGLKKHRVFYPAGLPFEEAVTLNFVPPLTYAHAQMEVGTTIYTTGYVDAFIEGYGQVSLNFQGTSTLSGFEVITVPSGTFSTVRLQVIGEISGTIEGEYFYLKEDGTHWLADEIGVVKQVGVVTDGIDTETLTLVLTQTNVTTSNPYTFSDVPPEHWAYDFISEIYNAGITAGCSQNPLMYCPDNGVTREQMAVFIIRSVEGEPPANYCDFGLPFTDVTSDMWSCRFIKRLKELGITGGYPDGRYGPYDLVNREQMAAFLVVAGEGAPSLNYCDLGVPFTDVTPGMWSCGYIKRLAELGITTGYGDGRYGPYDAVTRAQMAVFLSRAFLGM